jgi:hypothetical protein
MKRIVLFLALLLVVSISGCTSNNQDFTDTVTKGTWRVSYFISAGDEHTSLFKGYVFTFLADGTVNVTRPGAPPATGNWNEFNDNSRLDLSFAAPGLLQKLDEHWAIDEIHDTEILLHEYGAPFNQFNLEQI